MFKHEKQEEAKDKRNSEKKLRKKAEYEAWLAKMLADERTADVVSKLDELLQDYAILEDEAWTYTSRVNNQKAAILKLLEDNRALLLDKKQTLNMRNYVIGYTTNSKVMTTDKFRLVDFLEEFEEDTVQFQLSRTAIKGAMKSSTLREHLADLGVVLDFEDKWSVKDDNDWLEY